MRRATRFLVRFYPASWRRRYATEFETLLADVPSNFHGFLDVLMGALRTQLTTWTFGRIVAGSMIAGLLIAVTGSFLVPDRYRSQAVIAINPDSKEPIRVQDDALRSVAREAQLVLSNYSLAGLIHRFNLYPSEQNPGRWMMDIGAGVPIGELLEAMKRNIALVPIRGLDGAVRAFAIQFDYPDRRVAQSVTGELGSKFIDVNVSPGFDSHTVLELLDPASLPSHPLGMSRVSISTIGLFSGACLGLLIASSIWFRGRNRAASFSPHCGQPVGPARQTAR